MNEKTRILKKLAILSDEPAQRPMFNFDNYGVNLGKFIESDDIITPFSIAINGDWGMGKTTLLKRIKEYFDDSTTKSIRVIEFNAWKYENIDVVASLLLKIKKSFESDTNIIIKKFSKGTLKLIFDVFLRQNFNMSLKDAKKHFESFEDNSQKIKDDLKKLLGNERTLIIIDDLDRCHAENILRMLEAIKNFLHLDELNLVIVMGIDMSKIERAWELRYDSKIAKFEGRNHTEKMFDLKLSLPPKTRTNSTQYVNELSKLDDDYTKIILENAPKFNPRQIKKLLNSLYFVLLGLPEYTDQKIDFKIVFRICVAWLSLTLFHPNIAAKIQYSPSYFIRTAAICLGVNYLDTLREYLIETKKTTTFSKSFLIKTQQRQLDISGIFTEKIKEILQDIVNDESAFSIFKNFLNNFQNDFLSMPTSKGKPHRIHINKYTVTTVEDDLLPLLNFIIKQSGLVGA